jgi:hypothetical protein
VSAFFIECFVVTEYLSLTDHRNQDAFDFLFSLSPGYVVSHKAVDRASRGMLVFELLGPEYFLLLKTCLTHRFKSLLSLDVKNLLKSQLFFLFLLHFDVDWEFLGHFVDSKFPRSHDEHFGRRAILRDYLLILDVIFRLHKVFKLDESHARLVGEEGQALKEVNEALFLLHLDFFEKGLVVSLINHRKVAVGQAFYPGGTWLVVDESKLTKTLPGAELDYLHKETIVDFLPLLFVVAELQLYLSNDHGHQASLKFFRIFFYAWVEAWRWDCIFDTFVIKTPRVIAVNALITHGGFTILP